MGGFLLELRGEAVDPDVGGLDHMVVDRNNLRILRQHWITSA
jgi:hypothetical protein